MMADLLVFDSAVCVDSPMVFAGRNLRRKSFLTKAPYGSTGWC